jgi:hypothetical protein
MRARFGFHFPLMACMLISLVMTVVAIQRELLRTLACVRRQHIMPCYRQIASDCFIQSDWSCHVVELCFWLLIERNLAIFIQHSTFEKEFDRDAIRRNSTVLQS